MMDFITAVSSILIAVAVVLIAWRFRGLIQKQKTTDDDDDFWTFGI